MLRREGRTSLSGMSVVERGRMSSLERTGLVPGLSSLSSMERGGLAGEVAGLGTRVSGLTRWLAIENINRS